MKQGSLCLACTASARSALNRRIERVIGSVVQHAVRLFRLVALRSPTLHSTQSWKASVGIWTSLRRSTTCPSSFNRLRCLCQVRRRRGAPKGATKVMQESSSRTASWEIAVTSPEISPITFSDHTWRLYRSFPKRRGGQDKSQQRSKTTAGPSRSEPPAKRQKLDLSRKRSSATDEVCGSVAERFPTRLSQKISHYNTYYLFQSVIQYCRAALARRGIWRHCYTMSRACSAVCRRTTRSSSI